MLTAVGLGSDAAGQDPTAGAWPSCRQTKARLLFAGMVLGLGIPFAQRCRIGLRLHQPVFTARWAEWCTCNSCRPPSFLPH
jgi:hypothetical protein